MAKYRGYHFNCEFEIRQTTFDCLDEGDVFTFDGDGIPSHESVNFLLKVGSTQYIPVNGGIKQKLSRDYPVLRLSLKKSYFCI